MKRARQFLLWTQLAAVLWAMIFPPMGFAYDVQLSDDAIRDAYFLGQDQQRARNFLTDYTQAPSMPDNGPQVSQIQLRTPYAQIVMDSQQHTVGYSAQQAAASYKSRGDTIVVWVQIMFTPTYPNGDDDYWSTVPVGLIQKNHMAAISVSGNPIYSDPADYTTPTIGANIYVVFSAKGVESDDVTVEVIPPGGDPVHASFDLSRLR